MVIPSLLVVYFKTSVSGSGKFYGVSFSDVISSSKGFMDKPKYITLTSKSLYLFETPIFKYLIGILKY